MSLLSPFHHFRHSITFIKFLGEPGEELLVTGSEDRSLRLWDFGSGQKYAKRWKSEGLKTGCASSRHEEVEEMEKQHHREGKRGGQARRDVASIQCPLVERKREGHEHWVTCADMDVRFGVVYSGSMDRNVKAWDAFTGKCLRTYVGHIDWVNSVHVRGDIVYSCSDEGHVRLWRVASLLDVEDDDEQIDCWEEHSSPVKHLVGAGPRLITADVSGVVKCWDADALIHSGSLSSTM
jgi:WD40 repeat protein